MDVNTLRTLITAICFALFVAIVLWAYSGARRDRFAQAARLALDDDAERASGAHDGGGSMR
jgi:cytochrome c oxidase cbb3-type subunit 4